VLRDTERACLFYRSERDWRAGAPPLSAVHLGGAAVECEAPAGPGPRRTAVFRILERFQPAARAFVLAVATPAERDRWVAAIEAAAALASPSPPARALPASEPRSAARALEFGSPFLPPAPSAPAPQSARLGRSLGPMELEARMLGVTLAPDDLPAPGAAAHGTGETLLHAVGAPQPVAGQRPHLLLSSRTDTPGGATPAGAAPRVAPERAAVSAPRPRGERWNEEARGMMRSASGEAAAWGGGEAGAAAAREGADVAQVARFAQRWKAEAEQMTLVAQVPRPAPPRLFTGRRVRAAPPAPPALGAHRTRRPEPQACLAQLRAEQSRAPAPADDAAGRDAAGSPGSGEATGDVARETGDVARESPPAAELAPQGSGEDARAAALRRAEGRLAAERAAREAAERELARARTALAEAERRRAEAEAERAAAEGASSMAVKVSPLLEAGDFLYLPNPH
jgi:hypothetical protein